MDFTDFFGEAVFWGLGFSSSLDSSEVDAAFFLDWD